MQRRPLRRRTSRDDKNQPRRQAIIRRPQSQFQGVCHKSGKRGARATDCFFTGQHINMLVHMCVSVSLQSFCAKCNVPLVGLVVAHAAVAACEQVFTLFCCKGNLMFSRVGLGSQHEPHVYTQKKRTPNSVCLLVSLYWIARRLITVTLQHMCCPLSQDRRAQLIILPTHSLWIKSCHKTELHLTW